MPISFLIGLCLAGLFCTVMIALHGPTALRRSMAIGDERRQIDRKMFWNTQVFWTSLIVLLSLLIELVWF